MYLLAICEARFGLVSGAAKKERRRVLRIEAKGVSLGFEESGEFVLAMHT